MERLISVLRAGEVLSGSAWNKFLRVRGMCLFRWWAGYALYPMDKGATGAEGQKKKQ